MPLLEPAQWILGLYNTDIMKVHRGILWMDRPVPINVDLIATITGLPTDGEKPEQYLEDKTKENPSQMRKTDM
jgi:hypothetical protein